GDTVVADAATVTVGAVRSMFTPDTLRVVGFPARSVAVTENVWLAPSADFVTLAGQLATPVASAHVNENVTEPFHQPFAFAGGVAVRVMVGPFTSVSTE